MAPALQFKPDLIFLGGFTNDVILIIKALRGVGVPAPIFGAGPAGYDFVGKGLGDASDRYFTLMIWNWDIVVPGNKKFVAAYKAAHPNAPYPPANEMLGGGFAMGRLSAKRWKRRAAAIRRSCGMFSPQRSLLTCHYRPPR